MNDSVTARAIRYLLHPTGAYWSWTLEWDAAQWHNGETIAFVKEIGRVLSDLSENQTKGLPPLGAVLLVLTATRGKGPASRNFFEGMLTSLASRSLVSTEQVERLLTVLESIRQLPTQWTIEAKSAIASIVFENSRRGPADVGLKAIELLESDIREIWSDATAVMTRLSATEHFEKDALAFGHQIPEITEARLAARLKMGLDDVPDAVETEKLPEPETVRALMEELANDPKHFLFARAAIRFASLVSIPKPFSRADETEQVGVSDITNRGRLDRLLMTELANDDLMLAVRIANNEAMYLRQETPAAVTKQNRIMVFDHGLHSWGMPRLLASALGMAFVSQHNDDTGQTETRCFSALGNRLVPGSLRTRNGVVEHLNRLDPALCMMDCFPAIDDLLKQEQSRCELILFSDTRTWASTEFRFELEQFRIATQTLVSTFFIAVVDREGRTDLIELTSSGNKQARSIKIDIEELIRNPPVNKRVGGSLPAIFGIGHMPLRLTSGGIYANKIWPIGNEPDALLTLCKDHRVLLFDSNTRGGNQVADKIRQAPVLWYSRTAQQGVWKAIVGVDQHMNYRLLKFDEAKRAVEEIPLQIHQRPSHFCDHQGTVFAVIGDEVMTIDQQTGQLSLMRTKTGEGTWQGRFLKRNDEVFAVAIRGDGPYMLNVPVPKNLKGINHVYECNSVEGPVMVDHVGNAYFGETINTRDFQDSIDVKEIDPFTGGFFCQSMRGGNFHVDSLGSRELQPASSGSIKHHWIKRLAPDNWMRRKFKQVSLWSHGGLSIESKGGAPMEFIQLGTQLYLRVKKTQIQKLSAKRFESMPSPEGTKIELSKASWDDGSEAWLDSRGLLHLSSSDTELPELTLTLTDRTCAGWCSDGTIFGNRDFLSDPAALRKPIPEVLELIHRFVQRICES